MRLIDADVLKEDLTRFYDGEVTARQLIDEQPSVQPKPCEDDPRADVYYLAEKIGIHQLYALVVQLRGEPEPCEDAISRQAAIDCVTYDVEHTIECLKALPSAQPEKQHERIFQEIIVTKYPSYNPYSERKGKPYFSIKYTENGQEFIGYGTYKPEVLSKYLKEYFIPSVQPPTNCSEIPNGSDDTISRQAAIDALARMMPRSYTPDGSHPADEEIFRAQEVFVDCIEALEILPSAQPEIIRCKDCKWKNRYNCTRAVEVFIDDDKYCAWAERRTDE